MTKRVIKTNVTTMNKSNTNYHKTKKKNRKTKKKKIRLILRIR